MDPGRLLTAMVTPFDEYGQISWSDVTRIVNKLINDGSDGIVVGGTTGESPTLSHDEKEAVFRRVTEIVDGRATVIAGTGSNATHASVELTKRAEQCGVDGIMLVVPYYNKPSQVGLYEHFRTIASETTLPVMLYNVPGRTVTNMEPDTVVRLAEDVPNIKSIKEASGDMVQVTDIIHRTPENFLVYSGDDKNTMPMLGVGAHGVVSVASHVIGKEIKAMIEAFMEGDPEKAHELHATWLPMFEGLFTAPNPVPVKLMLSKLGYGTPKVRLPLVPVNETEQEEIMNLMQRL